IRHDDARACAACGLAPARISCSRVLHAGRQRDDRRRSHNDIRRRSPAHDTIVPLPAFCFLRHGCALALLAVLLFTSLADAQITAQARPAPTPPWTKGILPINPESYYSAIECGKQGGADPPCVFWDTGVCKNDDFSLNWYTGYKQVAYEVWA